MLAEAWRRLARILRLSASLPWEKFIRAMFMPDSIKRVSSSKESLAGPRVQMILVWRCCILEMRFSKVSLLYRHAFS